jgi:hypothetical protein
MKTHLLTVAAAAGFSLLAAANTPQAQTTGFAPDVNNGSAYNNNAIINLDPRRSYVRFANFRDQQEPVRNYVSVYDTTAKRVVGSFELDVRAKAAVQLSYADIVARAGLRFDDASERKLVLYVQNGRDKQLWQHVQYDVNTRNLENATVCSVAPHADYIAPHNVVMNVHSGLMKTQVSIVSLHNFGDVGTSFQANFYDAVSGQALGFVPITLESRQTFERSVAWYETEMGLKPSASQFHYNIEIVPTSFPHGKVVTSHTVLNTEANASANLSNPCALHGGIITIDFPT